MQKNIVSSDKIINAVFNNKVLFYLGVLHIKKEFWETVMGFLFASAFCLNW